MTSPCGLPLAVLTSDLADSFISIWRSAVQKISLLIFCTSGGASLRAIPATFCLSKNSRRFESCSLKILGQDYRQTSCLLRSERDTCEHEFPFSASRTCDYFFCSAKKSQVQSAPEPRKIPVLSDGYFSWLRGQDLNLRPCGYEPHELTGLLHPAIYSCMYDSVISPS